jgi:hypothetical protein
MRTYIIGNDGITLCREPPTAVNAGEIAVASNEELHAATLNGKRLLALWIIEIGLGPGSIAGKTRAVSGGYGQIPYACEQGICLSITGN